jgi:hypothetical protein
MAFPVLTGTELLLVTPLRWDGGPSPFQELTTTQAIADLGNGSNIEIQLPGAPSTVSGTTIVANGYMLQAWGFKGDGVSDDSHAVQALINATAPADLTLQFPAGSSHFGSGITSTGNRNITIVGEGSAATKITFAAGVAVGWNHGQGSSGSGAFSMRGVTLLPGSTATGTTGLRVSVQPSAADSRMALHLDDVQFGLHGSATWSISVDMYGCSNTAISNVGVVSTPSNVDAGSTSFRYQVAEGTSAVTVQASFVNVNTQDGQYGIWVGSGVQGIAVANTNLTGPTYGVYWPALPGAGSDQLLMSNTQIASAVRNVLVQNVTNVMLSNNYFIQTDQFTAGLNWSGVELDNCGGPIITGNTLEDPGGTVPSNVPAILLSSSIPSGLPGIISNNKILTFNSNAIGIVGAARFIKVIGNNCLNNPPSNTHAVLQTDAPAWAASTVYPAHTSVSANGFTFYSAAGGTSGTTSPTSTVPNDGGITWSVVGPTLAVVPNEVWGNSNFLTFDFQLAGPMPYIGQRTGVLWLPNQIELGGTAGSPALLDFHTTGTANTFDARIIATGGTSGTAGQAGLQLVANELGFFTTPPVALSTVTGAKGGNVALASLLTALAAYGLIIDSTTT